MGCCSSRTHHFDADELDKPSSGELDKPSSGELVERLVQQHAAAAANQSEGEVDCWAPIGAGMCPILPLPLSISAVRAALGEGCSDELAAFVEREARREYTEASTAFELVVASVAYDNSGVMHAVNGLLARVVAFVRAVAARKHEEGGGDTEAEAFVEEFMAKTFSTSGRGGGFGAFGSDPEAVRDLLADSTEERLREKTGVVNQEALLLAALEAGNRRCGTAPRISPCLVSASRTPSGPDLGVCSWPRQPTRGRRGGASRVERRRRSLASSASTLPFSVSGARPPLAARTGTASSPLSLSCRRRLSGALSRRWWTGSGASGSSSRRGGRRQLRGAAPRTRPGHVHDMSETCPPQSRQLEFRTLASEASQKRATRVHEGARPHHCTKCLGSV